jgi:hypothetical protein
VDLCSGQGAAGQGHFSDLGWTTPGALEIESGMPHFAARGEQSIEIANSRPPKQFRAVMIEILAALVAAAISGAAFVAYHHPAKFRAAEIELIVAF